MKTLTLLFSLMFFVIGANLTADDSKFKEHKARALKKVEERMAKLAEHKSCIEAATEKTTLKACHDKMKAWHEAQHAEHEQREQKK